MRSIAPTATRALSSVTFVPPEGRRRLEAALGGRAFWCISRQRAWGVPLPSFVGSGDEEEEEALNANAVRGVADIIAVHGADVWWRKKTKNEEKNFSVTSSTTSQDDRANRLIDDIGKTALKLSASDSSNSNSNSTANDDGPTRRGSDTLDVWFDSGSSWSSGPRSFPRADLVVEGSDQHRGWFQASALLAAATGCSEPPFKSILTHGFVLDA